MERDDALVINPQAELPDLLAQAGYGMPWDELDSELQGWLGLLLDALGVGKPEPVRESDMRYLAAALRTRIDGFGDKPDWNKVGKHLEKMADRIERAIGEKS